MIKAIIHLSDLHFRNGWIEDQGVVLDVFFQDLAQQMKQFGSTNMYLAFSGDIVLGSSDSLYSEFVREFDSRLNALGIPKSRRICVPGNHDVSIKHIAARIVEHEGVISQGLQEHEFNDYVANPSNVLADKFAEYQAFEHQFAGFGAFRNSTITGAGWEIAEGIGVYCLNTALCCSAGQKVANGSPLADKGRLAIDTRSLSSWNLNCKAPLKILIMHHPLDWLTEWAKRELETILRKHFSLVLYGHAHDQSTVRSVCQSGSLVACSAPPLFTNKSDDLGYAIVSVGPDTGVTEIAYRQWTKHQSFVAGVSFANTDDGKITIGSTEEGRRSTAASKQIDLAFVDRYLTKRLDEALLAFSSQPKVWVEPVVRRSPEIATDAEPGDKVDVSDLIAGPQSMMVKAPPQFGLTCLAHHMIREAWRHTEQPSLWLYLDARGLKPHSAAVVNAAATELQVLGFKMDDVKCVVLDSWASEDKQSYKLLQAVCTVFKGTRIIVMQTVDEAQFLNCSDQATLDREFVALYLWALPRGHVRRVVAEYNDKQHIGDEDALTTRILSDLEMLNIHRTPLNCLTLLKVSEIDFDESPVNRTELIKRVLFLLFNADDIPTYKARPDLKDCEYVLGYFCETLLRGGSYYFTRERFLSVLQEFCQGRLIDLEVQVVFDVLHANNILVRRGNLFCFKVTYWIYYFAAQRMHHDERFADFIFADSQYAKYPEIIEFYTGIDRRREDALRVLIKDLRATCGKMRARCGLPEGLNPYRFAQWRPSAPMLEQMQSEVCNGVLGSNLPESVKDRYADRQYDRTRPYHQDVRDILAEYSFVFMMQTMRAAAKALRNSDYADPAIRRELLQEIMGCWEEVSKVLLILVPPLAEQGRAIFEGALFLLVGSFGDTPQERFNNIVCAIPQNVIELCHDDLSSQKMGPLLLDQLGREDNDLKRHELVLLVIKQRPRGWKARVQEYIASTSKNSFYLLDVYLALRAQYRYGYAPARSLGEIEYLIKMAAAKHATGSRMPGIKLINKISDKVIPSREVDPAS